VEGEVATMVLVPRIVDAVTPVPVAAAGGIADARGVVAAFVDRIKGLDPHPMDKAMLPGCTYCNPQIASVGLTEARAKVLGFEIRVKPSLTRKPGSGASDSFVKL
jgi:pyruvate/2-oxoglutarate dehydrogenase complex dihydrolipoamide dehydrogenase (E3) component